MIWRTKCANGVIFIDEYLSNGLPANAAYIHFNLLTRNYRHALSYHTNLIKGFTRSTFRNKLLRSLSVDLNAEQIARETGANADEVKEFLYARLEKFLI